MIDEKRLIEVLNGQKYILTFEDSNPIDEGFNYGIDRTIQLISSQPKIGEWILFTVDEDGFFNCKIPEVDEEILVSDGNNVWCDTWIEYEGFALDSNLELDGLAWQPLPNPYVKE